MSGDNNIPNDWVETTLGEVCDLLDCLHKTPKYSTTGLPMVRVTDVENGILNTIKCLRVNDEIFKAFSKSYEPKIGDIVFTRVGSFGLSAIVKREEKFCIGQNTTLIISNGINSFFLFYYLISSAARYQIEGLSSGSTQPTISMASIRKIILPLPPLPEQKAIAKILTAFDDKIDLLHRQNKTLEAIAQTLFKEWFGKESDNWELIKISKFVEISSSKRIFHGEYVDNGIPFYRSKEIIELSTKPDISTELFISKERFDKIKNKFDVPIKGDILLTAVGTLGVSFQVRDNNPFYFKDGNLIWFKNFNEQLTSDFLYNWLKLKSTQSQLGIISIGSTQKALTIASIKELEIPFIKNSIKRREFNELLKSSLNKVNHNQFQILTLKKTRDTLLPKLMSGQIRVDLSACNAQADEFKKDSLC